MFTKDVISDIQNFEMKNNEKDDSLFSNLSNFSKRKNVIKGNNSFSKDNAKSDNENDTKQSIENILSILNDKKDKDKKDKDKKEKDKDDKGEEINDKDKTEKDKDDNYISAYVDKDNHTIDSVRYALNNIWRKKGQ